MLRIFDSHKHHQLKKLSQFNSFVLLFLVDWKLKDMFIDQARDISDREINDEEFRSYYYFDRFPEHEEDFVDKALRGSTPMSFLLTRYSEPNINCVNLGKVSVGYDENGIFYVDNKNLKTLSYLGNFTLLESIDGSIYYVLSASLPDFVCHFRKF